MTSGERHPDEAAQAGRRRRRGRWCAGLATGVGLAALLVPSPAVAAPCPYSLTPTCVAVTQVAPAQGSTLQGTVALESSARQNEPARGDITHVEWWLYHPSFKVQDPNNEEGKILLDERVDQVPSSGSLTDGTWRGSWTIPASRSMTVRDGDYAHEGLRTYTLPLDGAYRVETHVLDAEWDHTFGGPPGRSGQKDVSLDFGSGATPTPSPSASPSPAPSPTGPSTSVGPVTISGGTDQTPPYGSAFVITGTAPAGATVRLNFHQAGTAPSDYGIVREVVADGNGAWSRPIRATVDYRYYASVGSERSGSVLNRPAPTVDGALSRMVDLDEVCVLTGAAKPGSVVHLHFHARGTAAGDYGIVRSVRADSSGVWARPYLASTDYRVYVSASADDGPRFPSYLVLAR